MASQILQRAAEAAEGSFHTVHNFKVTDQVPRRRR